MKKLIIIGGGFAGSIIAKRLQKEFSTTLIDSKDYFEFTPSILRTIVKPNHLKGIQMKHEFYLSYTRFMKGKITEVAQDHVALGTKKLFYDYLAICSGSMYNSPIKTNDVVQATRAHILEENHTKLDKAKSVLIIGGGLVGIELAAEIATHYEGKKITLVHLGERLIERNGEKSSKYCAKFLKRKKVKIVLREKITGTEGSAYITDKGKRIKADIAFMCTGIVPNSDFMKSHMLRWLNERGQIRVNDFLQVDKNIFCAGDVNSIREEKTAQNAESQGEVVARNILAFENKTMPEEYESKKRAIVISLGKWNGIIEYKGFMMTGIIPAMLKYAIEVKTMLKYRW